jgi:hypothetical protein
MISPIAMNSKDLNRACVSMWKKPRLIKPLKILRPMNPKWLRVDRAISFLRSVSKIEFNPA